MHALSACTHHCGVAHLIAVGVGKDCCQTLEISSVYRLWKLSLLVRCTMHCTDTTHGLSSLVTSSRYGPGSVRVTVFARHSNRPQSILGILTQPPLTLPPGFGHRGFTRGFWTVLACVLLDCTEVQTYVMDTHRFTALYLGGCGPRALDSYASQKRGNRCAILNLQRGERSSNRSVERVHACFTKTLALYI